MARPLARAPSLSDWPAAASGLGLQRRGGELVGPCPACRDGEDRFRVTQRGGFFCRHCCPDGKAGADAMRRILEAAGMVREDDGASLAPGTARREARTRTGAASQIRGVSTYPEGPERRSTALLEGRNSGDPAPKAEFGAESWNPAHAAPDGLPARIWAASLAGNRDAAPVRAYLAGRGAWPPDAALPPSVRWLPREAAARLAIRLPAEAAGAAVYAFAGESGICAVQLEPLAESGERKPWPPRKPGGKQTTRQSRGPMRGAAFRVPGPNGAAYPVHVAEGPVDALAIAAWRGVRAWASSGTSGLAALAPALTATGRAVVIEADGDGPGRKAAAALQDALHRADAQARLFYWRGCDPAEGLAADWQEHAGRLEDDSMGRPEAEAAAWNAMRPAATVKEIAR